MSQDRPGECHRLARGNRRRTHCMPQGMRRHAGQISLLDDLLPWRLITPEIAIAFSGGKNELGILGLPDCLDHSDRSGADRPHGLPGLGASKTQAAMLELRSEEHTPELQSLSRNYYAV